MPPPRCHFCQASFNLDSKSRSRQIAAVELDEATSDAASRSPTGHSHQPWVSSVAGHGAFRVAGFASSVILARALGPTDRGAVGTLIAWTFTILGLTALTEVTPSAYFF